MVSQILEFLLETASGFLVFLLLARFHFQWLRISFRNQVGEFIIALTNWLVMPARRLIPGLSGYDLPTLVITLVLQAATLALVQMLRGVDFSGAPGAAIGLFFGFALFDLLRYSVYLLIFALVMQAVLSWVNPHSPFGGMFEAIVRPFLRPLRRRVPPVANIDLTPLLLIVLLQVLLIPLAYGRAMYAGLF